MSKRKQTTHHAELPTMDDATIEVTAGEWGMIIVTAFTGIAMGPLALVPGAVLLAMFAYRLNPELMRQTKAGAWVRGLLPAPTEEEQEETQPAQPSKAHVATVVSVATTTPADPDTADLLTLSDLAVCSTILLVGSRGSGKTTLLNAILGARKEAVMMYDPHAAPSDWPMVAQVHNSEVSIAKGLVGAYKRLVTRKDERRTGVRSEGWPRFTLAADEWRAIINDVTLPDVLKMTPTQVSSKLMREGRKFDIGMIIGAHGTTNAQLGCEGDNAGFLDSFDWIIYLGAEGRKMYAKHAPDVWPLVPLGKNPQGGTFPLVSICISPTTGDVRFLNMQGFDKLVKRSTAVVSAKSPPDDALLSSLIHGERGHENFAAPEPVTKVSQPVSDVSSHSDAVFVNYEISLNARETAKIIAMILRNEKQTAVVKAMPGYRADRHKLFVAKYEELKTLTVEQQSVDDEPDIGPFGYLRDQ